MPIRSQTPTPTAGPTASPFSASPFDDGGRITAASRAAFFLRAHPLAWEVVEVDGAAVWVPQLSRHELLPGAQGIRTLTRAEEGDPRLAWRAARQQQESEGFVYLDPTAQIAERYRPEGIDASTYCYGIPCVDRQRRPGMRFTELWEVPVPTPAGMSQVFRYDHERANAWRASRGRWSGAPAQSPHHGSADPPRSGAGSTRAGGSTGAGTGREGGRCRGRPRPP